MLDTQLAPLDVSHIPVPALTLPGPADLLSAFLAGRKASTLRAYRKDLRDFATYLGVQGSDDNARAAAAVATLVSGSAGQANGLVLGYRADMTTRRLAPATIARRLAALRSVVKLARTLGQITWAVDVGSPRVDPYRDTSGPGLSGWRRMLAEAQARSDTPKGARDLAMIRLMHDLALRRGEAVGLDLEDVDLERRTVAVIGKGRDEKTPLTLNEPTAAALAAWIALRGSWSGPLFVRLDRAAGTGQPARLHANNTGRVTHGLGQRAGLARGTNPHGLRHQGITRALDLAGGDVRRVRRFSRHAKVETLLRYDDNRVDEAGAIARLLGEDSVR